MRLVDPQELHPEAAHAVPEYVERRGPGGFTVKRRSIEQEDEDAEQVPQRLVQERRMERLEERVLGWALSTEISIAHGRSVGFPKGSWLK